MSFDFDTTVSSCDHRVLKERVSISPLDHTTIINPSSSFSTRLPIVSSGTLKMYIQGSLVTKDHPIFGWNILPDGEEFGQQRFKIVLKRPSRWSGPMEIDYTTSAPYCIKCQGKGSVNDLTIGSNGSFTQIQGYYKLLQRTLKFLLTSSCSFYPRLTSSLKNLPGSKWGNLMEEDISQEIARSLGNLQSLQVSQKSVQSLDPEEVLKSVGTISVKPNLDDPSKVKVTIQASSYGNSSSIPISITLRASR